MSSYEYPEHFAEMVPDGKGSWRLSERAVAARTEILAHLNRHKVPMRTLDPKYDVRINPYAPEMLFGFKVRRAHVLQYGLERELLPEDYAETLSRRGAILPVVRYLRDILDATVYLRIPYSEDGEDMVICLYTNHTMEDEKYIEEDEQEVLAIIREEFELNDAEPMWYWDVCT